MTLENDQGGPDVLCPFCGEWEPARSRYAPYDSLVCKRIHEDLLDTLDLSVHEERERRLTREWWEG